METIKANIQCSDRSFEHRVEQITATTETDFGSSNEDETMRVRQYFCFKCGMNIYDNNKGGYDY